MLIRKISLTRGMGTFGWWQLASLAMIGLMGGAVIVSTYFIYENIFQTLANANEAVILSGEARFEAINTTNYEKAVVVVNLKKSVPAVPDNLRNMFYFVSSTAATTSHVTSSPATPPKR